MTDTEHRTVVAMETYGGAFVKALAVACWRADEENFARIKATWNIYWDRYTAIAEREQAIPPAR